MLCKGKTKAGIACKDRAVLDGYCELHHPGWKMKYDDPTKAYRDTMRHVDMMEGHRDAMKVLDPVKEHRDAMKVLDPVKEYREAMKHVHSMKGLHESIKFILPTERFKDALEATNLWNQMGSLHQQIKDLKSTINADNISSLIKKVRVLNTQLGITDFGTEPSINPDGTLTFSNDSMSLQPLHEAGSQVILRAIQGQNTNISEAIERLIIEVRSLKNPIVQKIIIQLIFPVVFLLMGAFVYPFADFHVKNYLNKNEKKQISTQINQSVVDNVQAKEVLRHLRYVKANVLCVMKNKSKSGELIGYLYFGQVVEVLEKRKNWSRIKWVDETGEISIEGWVFTRYLKKFK